MNNEIGFNPNYTEYSLWHNHWSIDWIWYRYRSRKEKNYFLFLFWYLFKVADFPCIKLTLGLGMALAPVDLQEREQALDELWLWSVYAQR